MPLLCPYMKYDNWYIPSCNIAFPTDIEAWEYLYEHFMYEHFMYEHFMYEHDN